MTKTAKKETKKSIKNLTKAELIEMVQQLASDKKEETKKDFDTWAVLLKNESKQGKTYYPVGRFKGNKFVPLTDPDDPTYDLVAFPMGPNGHIAINRFKNC
jgi:hypothetical protein